MFLEIDGKAYFIYPRTDIDYIRVKKVDKDAIHLYVPALLPHNNLTLYIQKELPKILSNAKNNVFTSISELSLFDKKYPIRITNISAEYIENDIIYTNENTLASTTKIEKLKFTLLENAINQLFSDLEETLNIILPSIKLKKLKTNYYSICHTKEYITYSKTLIDKSKDFITYVVILAVGKYLNCSEEQINDLMNKYVLNPKHCERVYKYEQ